MGIQNLLLIRQKLSQLETAFMLLKFVNQVDRLFQFPGFKAIDNWQQCSRDINGLALSSGRATPASSFRYSDFGTETTSPTDGAFLA